MEIKYQIFKEENLLIQKFIGIFSIEQYMQYVGYLMGGLATNMINYVLIDFRDIKFDIIPDDFEEGIDKMIKFRKRVHNDMIKRKDVTVVFWVKEPLPTAIAHIFKDIFKRMNYHQCSTLQNILDKMNIPKHINLENVLNNLENTYKAI